MIPWRRLACLLFHYPFFYGPGVVRVDGGVEYWCRRCNKSRELGPLGDQCRDRGPEGATPQLTAGDSAADGPTPHHLPHDPRRTR